MSQKTLLNYCQNTLESGSVLSMEKGTAIVGRMPFKQIHGNSYSFNVIDTLLPTAHRQLGQDVESNEFETRQVTKPLVILTNSVKTDRALAVMSDLTEIKAEGQTLAMVSSGKALEGFVIAELKKAIETKEAGEKFAGELTVDLLDDTLDFVAGANMIFCNNKGHRALKKLLKAEGMSLETVESFGKRVIAFGGVPVHASHDLADNEILVVNFSEEAVHGITNGALKVYEKEVGTQYVTDTELLYNVVYKVKNSFALVEVGTARKK